MIVDKKKPAENEQTENQPAVSQELTPIQEAVAANPMVGAYQAVKEILLSITKDPDDPNSGPYFQTVKWDNGQLSRVKMNTMNHEYAIRFPAVFIHYIDVYNTVNTFSIGEGKGTMRIHYVLNRLNNADEDTETEGLEIYKRIVSAIESNKSKFPALISRFQLAYWDQPLSFDDGLQPYWIDYQIWFRDYTTYVYRDYLTTYLTMPPFTQPSDQNEIANPDHLPNWETPTFEETSDFEDSLGE